MPPVRPLRLLRVDLHTHTTASPDGATMTPEALIERAIACGLDKVAVTDHHTIEGALAAQALAPDRIIVGEEITADDGTDVIGLFLRAPIRGGRPLTQIVRDILDQGGVVYAPHPFAYLSDARGKAERLVPMADVVEVFNARAFWPAWNRRAAAAAAAHRLPGLAGSDAHTVRELGRVVTEIPVFTGPHAFRVAARYARVTAPRITCPLVHVTQRLRVRGLPAPTSF